VTFRLDSKQRTENVLTVVAETVMGSSGVIPAPKGYFRAMKSVCRKYGALFILDEVTCGMGRESTCLAVDALRLTAM
jgi:adenosylmethionine-8-amino-7-oxononanoate aminotransferase